MPRFEIPDGWCVQAFRFTLDPTEDQARALARHFGARRKAYNWTVAALKADIAAWHANGIQTATPSLRVLRKRWNTVKNDVCVNAVGGVRIEETAWDLPVVIALASSLAERIVPGTVVAFGELGLTGEVRPVAYGEERLQEALKQGFQCALVPRDNAPRRPIEGLRVVPVARIDEALAAAFNAMAPAAPAARAPARS